MRGSIPKSEGPFGSFRNRADKNRSMLTQPILSDPFDNTFPKFPETGAFGPGVLPDAERVFPLNRDASNLTCIGIRAVRHTRGPLKP